MFNYCRLADDDEDAATVGTHTWEPCQYPHPLNLKLVFCDLPGYYENKYPKAKTFCQEFELGKFDGLLIIIKDELTEFDLALVKEIQLIGTPFLVIRTHIDQYFKSDKPSKRAEKLEKIKNQMIKRIPSQNAEVFLINTYDSGEQDFILAAKAITNMASSNPGNVFNFNRIINSPPK